MYRIRMDSTDSKKILWENVSHLMVKRFGKENLTKLAEKAKFGPGTSTRLKGQETSVGTDILDQIAKAFGVETWQLLVPGLNIDALPKLDNGPWPFELIRPDQYARLDNEFKRHLENNVAGEWLRVQAKTGTNN